MCLRRGQDMGQRAGRRGTIHAAAAAADQMWGGATTGKKWRAVAGRKTEGGQVAGRPKAREAEGGPESRGRGGRNAGRGGRRDADTMSRPQILALLLLRYPCRRAYPGKQRLTLVSDRRDGVERHRREVLTGKLRLMRGDREIRLLDIENSANPRTPSRTRAEQIR